jgi:outer membrane protein assembly factor BamB
VTTPRTTTIAPHSNKIAYNTCLYPDDERYSEPKKCFKLVFQHDGNLVAYRVSDGAHVWHSQTHGKGGNRACMQTDGNLVIYTPGNVAVWNTQTAGKGHSEAYIQDDGNLVIYQTGGSHTSATMSISHC